MKRNSRSIIYSGSYTSPNTPEYGDKTGGGGSEMEKSWSSERVVVASPTNQSIRWHVSAAALMPFNSGRALPSKWDDAERWITSPVSRYGFVKSPIAQPPRRLQSKSGPLGGPSGVMGNSPLTTDVLVPDDNKPFGGKEEGSISHGANLRDIATQMSPNGSTCSSSRERLSFSDLPSTGPSFPCQKGNPAAKDEVRDVQVDKGITKTGMPEKQEAKRSESSYIQDASLPWNASKASKNMSKLQREEAKITAWENLQKTRAEAAIRKLKMKLEKKRSESMDKILNKFRASQMKAQAMRNLLPERDAAEARSGSSIRKYVKLHLRCNCFVCRRS